MRWDCCADCEEIHEQHPEGHYCCHCECHLADVALMALMDGWPVEEEPSDP